MRELRGYIQPERLNRQTERIGEACISGESKRVFGFERLHSLEFKFISLVGLVNRENGKVGVCVWWGGGGHEVGFISMKLGQFRLV